MHAGEPLAPDAAVPAGVSVLVLDDTVERTAAMVASAKPRTIFVGMVVELEARLGLPEGAPLVVGLKSWRNPELWKIRGAQTLEDFERKVYKGTIDRAFTDWQKKLVDTSFR